MVAVDQLAIPKAKQTQLKKKGLLTTDDLLRMVPLHTYDFSTQTSISQLRPDVTCAIYGEITHKESNSKFTKLIVDDKTGTVDVVLFGQSWLANKFEKGMMVTVGGKVKKQGFFTSFTNPELLESGKTEKLLTKYSKVNGMSEDYLRKCIRLAEQYPIQETLDRGIREKFRLVDAKGLVQCIHHPRSADDVKKARRRLFFEELFEFNLRLFASRKRVVKKDLPPMSQFESTEKMKASLPFSLTEDQASVLRQISYHFKKGKRINALVQGDVGSGKTMVGLFALLMNAENGNQGVLMAPTTVLAQQHYQEAIERLSPLGYKVVFIHGGLKTKEKREVLKLIETGAADVVIGTHAAISKDVLYQNLRVVIVDEEHRFGVEQRDDLEAKASEGAHKLSLTATPIPRTLAHTMYGDDVQSFAIKTMPGGRKRIKTARGETLQGLKLMREEIKKGHQAYIVCPLIDPNPDINAVSAKEAHKKACHFFNRDGIRVGLVHGKMKQEDIDKELEKFLKKEYDVLVSTTIIEVGVNIPNATVMMIESADRFGLSQLHQLRGRVGRSSFQSYCLLATNENITEEANYKLDVLVQTTDGFEISEADMKLRGTGNLVGTEQTGASQALAMMIRFPKFSSYVQEEVKEILNNPFRLEQYRYIFDKEVE